MTEIILKQGTGVPSDSDVEVAEVALDTSSGAMYTKLADGSVKHLNPVSTGGGGSGGGFVHVGEAPPSDPQEGQEWLEIPADGDATMWIYDGDKWLQHPGGKDGAPGADGNIADATEQGVIATWDNTSQQWTPDSSMRIDADGNVGIGDNPSNGVPGLVVHSQKNIGFSQGSGQAIASMFRQTSSGSFILAHGYMHTATPNGFASSFSSSLSRSAISVGDAAIRFYTDASSAVPLGTDVTPTERMTIDANGNATFSAGAEIKAAEHDTVASLTGAITFPRVSGNTPDFAALFGAEDGRLGVAAREGIKFYTGGGNQYQQTLERMYIDTDGNVVTGSEPGYVNNPNGTTLRPDGTVYTNNVQLADSSGSVGGTSPCLYSPAQSTFAISTARAERMRIDADGRVDITGSLYVNGVPKIGTSELIETLSTLREATKDETTIKGLRDAIGNAVGGLIEKFEAMQSPVTQEISDE